MELQLEEADSFISLLSNETLDDSGPEMETFPALADIESQLYEFDDIGRSLMTDPFLSPPCSVRCHTVHAPSDATDSHPSAFQSVHHLPYTLSGPLDLCRPLPFKDRKVQPNPVPAVNVPAGHLVPVPHPDDYTSCSEVTSTMDVPSPKRWEDSESTDAVEKSEDSSNDELYSPQSHGTRSRSVGPRPKGRRPRSRCFSASNVLYPERCRPDEVQTPVMFKSEDDRKDFNNARERGRIRWQNEGFQRLKELLPSSYSSGRKSMTKGQILHKTADLVITLMNQVEDKRHMHNPSYTGKSAYYQSIRNIQHDRSEHAESIHGCTTISKDCMKCRRLLTEKQDAFGDAPRSC